MNESIKSLKLRKQLLSYCVKRKNMIRSFVVKSYNEIDSLNDILDPRDREVLKLKYVFDIVTDFIKKKKPIPFYMDEDGHIRFEWVDMGVLD